MDDPDFEGWFRLAHTPGLGRSAARALLARFGSPRALLEAPAAAWRTVVHPRAAAALLDAPEDMTLRILAARSWLAQAPRRTVLALGDEAYPPLLLQTADPPLLMYVEGDVGLLSRPGIAMVGSRHPTAAGRDNARAFSEAIARNGWVVVSGLARGVDGAAHEGALGVQGATVAVVGCGLDQTYPPTHKALARQIAAEGALVSEFAPGTPPLAAHFPQRNRIIAGLSRGVLVVEAALQSGSLITARLANEAGREVFAIPGSIHSPQSRGCHALIKQGAKLVESAEDIFEELSPGDARAGVGTAATDPDTGSAGGSDALDEGSQASSDDPLLQALGWEPATLDALGARLGWSAAALSSALLERELCGDVVRQSGGVYQRVRRA